jgi:hypothetical protein
LLLLLLLMVETVQGQQHGPTGQQPTAQATNSRSMPGASPPPAVLLASGAVMQVSAQHQHDSSVSAVAVTAAAAATHQIDTALFGAPVPALHRAPTVVPSLTSVSVERQEQHMQQQQYMLQHQQQQQQQQQQQMSMMCQMQQCYGHGNVQSWQQQ